MKNIVTGSSGLLDPASKRQWGEVPGDRREGTISQETAIRKRKMGSILINKNDLIETSSR